MNKTTEALAMEALNRIADKRNVHFSGDAQVVAREALAAIREALAEQEKQEPVYAFRRRGLDDFCTCTKKRYEELADMPNLFEVTTFYAAPVDAKAIRAEALEKAAKVCRTAQAKRLQSIREAIEAAIRGLK